jgi:hypothetical protein
MILLDEEETQLLALARQKFTPEPQQARRVHAAVLAAVAVPSGSDLAEGLANGSNTNAIAGGGNFAAVSHGLGALGTKAWLAGVALVLGVSAGAGVWAFGGASEDMAPPLATTAPKVVPATQSAPTTQPVPPTQSTPPMLTPQPQVPAPTLVTPEIEPANELPPAPRSTEKRPRLDLRKELSAVREAEQAVNSGDPERALVILDQLQRSPGGELREERAALRVLAHCQLGSAMRLDHAQSFLSTHVNSVYAPRIRAACGE